MERNVVMIVETDIQTVYWDYYLSPLILSGSNQEGGTNANPIQLLLLRNPAAENSSFHMRFVLGPAALTPISFFQPSRLYSILPSMLR